ncbi:MAG: GT-D fold domain-containing glycosyltransferase [Bacteroidota bacterium]|nr:GT-D fold domain-containing glycosyltransferase [Bacteroidota bacterium]
MKGFRKICKERIDEFMAYFARYLMERYDMDARLRNLKYEIADSIRQQEIVFPKIIPALETLDKLIAWKCSICRYGDGEFSIMQGHSIRFQSYHPLLSSRLLEIIKSDDESILVGIPDSMGSLERFQHTSQQWARVYYGYNRESVYNLIDFQKVYYDSGVTRPYLNIRDKSVAAQIIGRFPLLWQEREIVLIEGEYTRAGIGNDLFANTKSIERIVCPNFDAFDHYDRILETASVQPKHKLMLIALGPTATVLTYDLAKQGFQAIDLGHLDIEYEWYKKGATTVQSVDGKYVNEATSAKRQSFPELKDEVYQKQIIARILK